MDTAGAEERFPWNLAPLRALAILPTVGLGAAMGTESPAAHLGVAAGTWLGSLHPALRPLVRPAAIGGGAAGAAAGIAGGYRLPFTAVAMVLGVGGPEAAKLTCLATVGVAALAGLVTARAINTLSSFLLATIRRMRSSRG